MLIKIGQVEHVPIVVTQREIEDISMKIVCVIMLWQIRCVILHLSLFLSVGAGYKSKFWSECSVLMYTSKVTYTIQIFNICFNSKVITNL